MKEKLTIIIKISLEKRQIDYKKREWITKLGNRSNSKKKNNNK